MTLPKKRCRECRKPFQPKRKDQVMCSIPCRQKVAGRVRTLKPKTCPMCGEKFQPRTRIQRFCSMRCRAMEPRKPMVPCPVCQQEFRPKWRQKFCSKTCANQAAKTRHPKPCERCGVMFMPKETRSRFCGRSCGAKAAGLARRSGKLMRTPHGYLMRYQPEHPMAGKQGMVMEHRRLMAEHLGRVLQRSEVVHHVNGVRDDNRIENLIVMAKAEHDGQPKQRRTEIECPHCRGRIGTSNAVRAVTAL